MNGLELVDIFRNAARVANGKPGENEDQKLCCVEFTCCGETQKCYFKTPHYEKRRFTKDSFPRHLVGLLPFDVQCSCGERQELDYNYFTFENPINLHTIIK